MLEPADPTAEPIEELRRSYRFSDPVLSELALEPLLDTLLIRIQEALAVDTVAILLYEAESDQLVARAAKGIEEEVERGVRIPLGRGFAGRIAAERVAIFIADVDHADVIEPDPAREGHRVAARRPTDLRGRAGWRAPRRLAHTADLRSAGRCSAAAGRGTGGSGDRARTAARGARARARRIDAAPTQPVAQAARRRRRRRRRRPIPPGARGGRRRLVRRDRAAAREGRCDDRRRGRTRDRGGGADGPPPHRPAVVRDRGPRPRPHARARRPVRALLNEAAMATAAYAVFDTYNSTLQYATAATCRRSSSPAARRARSR